MYGVGEKLNSFAQPVDDSMQDMGCTVLDMIFHVYLAELGTTISHNCFFFFNLWDKSICMHGTPASSELDIKYGKPGKID